MSLKKYHPLTKLIPNPDDFDSEHHWRERMDEVVNEYLSERIGEIVVSGIVDVAFDNAFHFLIRQLSEEIRRKEKEREQND